MPRLHRFTKIFQRFTIPRLEVRPFGKASQGGRSWRLQELEIHRAADDS